MATEVFNRIENKYLLNEKQLKVVESVIRNNMTADPYSIDGKMYTITNVYYDTLDNNLIRTSLQKPKYKEKLRLRSYGIPELEDKVFVEIKKKVNGLVNKRRTKLKLYQAEKYLLSGVKPVIEDYMNEQVINEISYFIKTKKLYPAVYIAYDRKAYFGKNDSDLRLTIDTNIRTRRDELSVSKGDYGDQLLDRGLYLMEIKSSKSIPLWLTEVLSSEKIYKTSFSKYGREYKNFLTNNIDNIYNSVENQNQNINKLCNQVPCLI